MRPLSGTPEEVTTYHYENASFIFHLTGITDARGIRVLDVVYDSQGRVSESGLAGGVDKLTFSYGSTPPSTFTTTITNALSKQTVKKYQIINSIRRFVGQDGVASASCPASATQVTYDSNGYVQDATDEEGRVTRNVNDDRGRPTSITRGFGTVEAVTTAYTWHPTFAVPTQMVEPGRTTDYTWDGTTGRLTSMSIIDTTSHTAPYPTTGQTRTFTYTYGTAGVLTTIDGPLTGTGDTITYGYDANGYVASVTNEIGQITTVSTVNGRGQPTRITDPNGVITDLVYDFQGRLTTITVNPGAGQAVTTIGYNAVGDVTSITRPDNSSLTYTYDNARRLTEVAQGDGQQIIYTRNLMGGITAVQVKAAAAGPVTFSQTQTFDELNRLLQHLGASNQTTSFAYEKNDNLKQVTDPRSGVYGFAYDSLNRLIRETDQDTGQVNLTRNGVDDVTTYSDPRSLSTTYVRNGFGEVIQEVSPDRGTTVTVRDQRGLATQITDDRGVVASMTYDNAGRITTKTYPSAPSENLTYSYDATSGGNKGVGRLTSLTDQSGSTTWAYDVRGNVLSQVRTVGGQAYPITYEYDLADRVSQVTYPSGRQVGYVRDTQGRITAARSRKSSAEAWTDLASSIVYRPMSRAIGSLNYGNGLTESNTWTSDYELGRCQVLDGATVLIDRTLARGDALNLTGITDNVVGTNSQTFGYSAPNRLTSATGPYGAFSWTYDLVGNRASETAAGVTDTYAYPATSNRIQTVTRGGATVRQITYDGAGGILTDTRPGGTTTYTYNARNRLATATSGALLWGYTYNGLEQLVTRSLLSGGADITHFIHDLWGNVIAETGGTGPASTRREYVWLPESEIAPTMASRTTVARPVAVIEDVDTAAPKLWTVHVDHLHRPIRMTDATRATVWAASWLPWGGVDAITGTAAFNLRFPGQWFQLETGLHYNWHRHYDATLGRYTQPDPLGFVDGPSVYGYAGGSPLRWVDAQGLWAHIIIGGIIGGGSSLLLDPCADWPTVLLSAAAGASFAAGGGPSLYYWLFSRGGAFNTGQYLRVGQSTYRPTKTDYFSIRGKVVDRLTGKKNKHIDLFRW